MSQYSVCLLYFVEVCATILWQEHVFYSENLVAITQNAIKLLIDLFVQALQCLAATR